MQNDKLAEYLDNISLVPVRLKSTNELVFIIVDSPEIFQGYDVIERDDIIQVIRQRGRFVVGNLEAIDMSGLDIPEENKLKKVFKTTTSEKFFDTAEEAFESLIFD